jgi:hypothetical protein
MRAQRPVPSSLVEARERTAELEIDIRLDLGTVCQYFADCAELERVNALIDHVLGEAATTTAEA